MAVLPLPARLQPVKPGGSLVQVNRFVTQCLHCSLITTPAVSLVVLLRVARCCPCLRGDEADVTRDYESSICVAKRQARWTVDVVVEATAHQG